MNDKNHNTGGGYESQTPHNLDLSLPGLPTEASLWNSPLGRRVFLKKTGAATVATAVALHGFRVQVQATTTGDDFTYSASGVRVALTVGGDEVTLTHTWSNGPGTGQWRLLFEKKVGEDWVECDINGGAAQTDAQATWTDKTCSAGNKTENETVYSGAIAVGVRVKGAKGRVKP